MEIIDHKPGRLLSKMLEIAAVAHSGQFDKGGQPYILHPLKVMHYTKSEDEEIQCIAIGHDLFEDTTITAFDLMNAGMTPRIINGIGALTRQDWMTAAEYRKQVLDNPDAIIVKLADLRHNSDIRRLKGITPKDQERMVRYHAFYLELKEKQHNA